MINISEQEDLFRLIANTIRRDLSCYAFGGNAMMYYGYKEQTKDVDIVFEHNEDRKEFLDALQALGYRETSLVHIYIPEKLKDPHAPLVYQRADSRFDVFVGKIFKTLLSQRMKEDLYAIHEYKDKHNLTIKILRREFIVLLKAITSREKDFDDIITISTKTKDFDWQYLIDEVIWQYQHGDSWVLLDTEKKLQDLKKYVFIEEKYFQQLYKALGTRKS